MALCNDVIRSALDEPPFGSSVNRLDTDRVRRFPDRETAQTQKLASALYD